MKRVKDSESVAKRLERLRKANKRLRVRLKAEEAKWHEVCPLGHLFRYDECALTCWLTKIDDWDTPLLKPSPKLKSPMVHDWTTRVPFSWGWWWRVPYGWWLSLVRWWKRTPL